MDLPYQAFRDTFLAASGAAMAFAAYAIASAPTREAQRFGMRGLMRERAEAIAPLMTPDRGSMVRPGGRPVAP